MQKLKNKLDDLLKIEEQNKVKQQQLEQVKFFKATTPKVCNFLNALFILGVFIISPHLDRLVCTRQI